MNKLLIVDYHYSAYVTLVKKYFPDCEVFASDDVNTLKEKAVECDIWLGAANLCADLLKSGVKAPKWIQSILAGITPLLANDLPKNYQLSRAVGVFDQLMAEYVLTYMLAHERTLISHYEAQKQQQWLRGEPATLYGKTVLVVGAGTIGTSVAKFLKPFGVRLLGIAHRARPIEPFEKVGVQADLANYIIDVDYVINLLPDTPDTHNIYNANIFSKMKEGSVFINAGRGVSIVDNDLIAALANNKPAFAVLDVFRTEPLLNDHPFWKVPNILLTGHSAAMGIPSLIFDLFRQNLSHFEKQEPLQGQVDFKKGY